MAQRRRRTAQKKLTDGDTILCIDESLYRYTPVTTVGWEKEGSYPVVTPVESDWRTVSAIGALALWLNDDDALQTRVFFRLHPDTNINSHLIRDFLHQVRLQLAGQITVLWDRGSVHIANRIGRFFETYDRFDDILIPTCCPELNPCEGVWDWSKYIDMDNVAPLTFNDLISRIRSSLTKMKHRGHVRRWAYHQSEIDLLN